jgi:nitrogen regulatory protein PII
LPDVGFPRLRHPPAESGRRLLCAAHPVGYGYEPNYFGFQNDDTFKRYSYLSIVKMEVVCTDQDVERFVQIIEDVCRTGDKGDGRIFVTDVVSAVRIRDGARGQTAL